MFTVKYLFYLIGTIFTFVDRYINYFEQYIEYDPFFTPPEIANPWLSDNPDFWEQEKLA